MEQTHSARAYETPVFDINYGAGDRVQLNVEVPYLIVDNENETHVSLSKSSRILLQLHYADPSPSAWRTER